MFNRTEKTNETRIAADATHDLVRVTTYYRKKNYKTGGLGCLRTRSTWVTIERATGARKCFTSHGSNALAKKWFTKSGAKSY